MSQHDFNIANQGFPAFRGDLNNALVALATNSSGTTEPATTYAYQWWFDTTLGVLKYRNAANTDWVLFEAGGGGATGGGDDEIFYENGLICTADYTVTGKNASTTGPISINSGVTITVDTGSRWVIL